MTGIDSLRVVLVAALVFVSLAAAPPVVDGGLPHLRKQGTATQLMVDGKPFVMLAGELHNSSASGVEYMKALWPRLTELGLNTVLAPVSWELIEPREGEFDFAMVDALLECDGASPWAIGYDAACGLGSHYLASGHGCVLCCRGAAG